MSNEDKLLMKNQMKWGLATLILLLGIAAVFLLMDKDTAKTPKTTLGQSTKDLLKQDVKSPQQANTSGAEKRQPPPGTSPNGHLHDGVWHDAPHTKLSETLKREVSVLTPGTGENSDDLERLNQKLFQDWKVFERKLQRKYPVLFDRQELARVAQTKAGRQKLKGQADALIAEQLEFFEIMVSQLPPEVAAETLRLTEELFMQNNQGLKPQHIKSAFERMRTKL